MPAGRSVVPQLLVSVRSVAEASAAVAGGCDLLDVKEPDRGSLGAADPETVTAICEAIRGSRRSVPVSVALGELVEWAEGREIPRLNPAVAFAKLGLGRVRAAADWPGRWQDLRSRFDLRAGRSVGWVAVAYADPIADAPGLPELIARAASTGCRGVLVDTFRKDGRGLFDHVCPEEVLEWRTAVEGRGLMFAVAGSLDLDDLPRLVEIRPDVVAIRGAACRRGERTASVREERVRQFRQALRACFAGP